MQPRKQLPPGSSELSISSENTNHQVRHRTAPHVSALLRQRRSVLGISHYSTARHVTLDSSPIGPTHASDAFAQPHPPSPIPKHHKPSHRLSLHSPMPLFLFTTASRHRAIAPATLSSDRSSPLSTPLSASQPPSLSLLLNQHIRSLRLMISLHVPLLHELFLESDSDQHLECQPWHVNRKITKCHILHLPVVTKHYIYQ